MAIAPDAEHRVIGARPGEKLHEAMFSITEAPYVARRGRHYIVTPRVGRWTLSDYCREFGDAEALDRIFEYDSGTNPERLATPEIRSVVKEVFGATV